MKKLGRKKRIGLLGIVLIAEILWLLIPSYDGDLKNFHAATQIYDRNEKTLRTTLGENDLFCIPIPLNQMGEWTTKALIAFEDKRFLKHGGVDPIAICRATLHNVANGRVVSGASTLTTLVVKMTEPRKRNLLTKVIEANHACDLETALSKEEILEQFINRAPFGGNIYGIEAASTYYLGKQARDLSLSESALLMGLPQSPHLLRPDRHLNRALIQRNKVLTRMKKMGSISESQYKIACAQKITIRKKSRSFFAPHFCDFILKRYPNQKSLQTTLDFNLQQIAQTTLQTRISELAPFGIQGGGVIIIDVRTGALRAMVGSPNFWISQINGTTARRSPGSTLKPFAYAMAMEEGMYTPASLIADIPTSFANYHPKNYSLKYSGAVSLRQALVQSLNIPALRCVQQIGLNNYIEKLRNLGFTTLNRSAQHYGLGIVLGSGETTLLELSNAYACLAREGTFQPLRFLKSDPTPASTRLYSKSVCFMISNILGGEERSLEFVGHQADIFIPQIAWKTGTSTGFRDAWCIAYNPDYVVGIWMGNPDGSPSPKLIGGTAAAPIACEIFRQLYPNADAPWFKKPATLKTRTICAHSGKPCSIHCRVTKTDYYIPQISSPHPCTLCSEKGESWSPEIEAFLKTHGIKNRSFKEKSLSIQSPQSGTKFRLLPVQKGRKQEIELIASSSEKIYWFVDGKLHPSTFWALKKGQHTIACSDTHGHTAQAIITVE